MRKSKWSDEQIEELLSQMPKIKDNRDPREIYQSIEMKIGKRKQKTWILPAAAAAAALLLFFILAPSLINWQESADKSVEIQADKSSSSAEIATENNLFEAEDDEAELKAKEEIGEDKAEQFDDASKNNAETESNDQISLKSLDANTSPTAVYEEDLTGKEVLTYAIPDQTAQNIVPVSVLVEEDPAKSKFELFEDSMSRLTEEEWGLTDYYPLKANFSYDQENRTLTVDVPEDHPYSMSSTTELLLEKVLGNVMHNLEIEKVNLATEGQKGIEFSHFGYRESLVPEKGTGNLIYYFLYPDGSESKPFMVPLREKFDSIKDALRAMKENRGEDNLQASIPEDINFEAEEIQERKLLIRFESESEIIDNEPTLHTIEAILLTAKEFNFETVKLENADVDKIGNFDLSNELKVPVAANKRELPN
ncbi:hypothetical protein J7I93_01950 [Bacillus sp. ISL-47]|uniref:hypothetical protein n=1 Tax=Bacillus sp. ISL-47 TaxID=2819130 RepID=UPI001BE775E1|nr:hypothetical protein [Bacillus sp. ISL-47]MBT2686938.1 hypothetical protein [Bacillus sp. ISL-47]MBT2707762.1 hypothetical protein [Pseudomonas sp. ISL-84]